MRTPISMACSSNKYGCFGLQDGKRDGVGVKMYGDGSTFHGIWREGKKHGVGVFKPATKDREKDHRTRMTPKTNIGRPTVSPADGDSVSNLRVDESSQPSDAKLVRHGGYA